ncbi:MAG: dihydroorotate dehydrogenase electron transfer subunit [Spirochaetia bacterium]
MTGSLHRAARVVEKVQENAATITFVLDAAMEAAPGQFAMLWLPGIDEKPFSIAGADPLTFTVSRVGPFSEMLHALAPGDTLWVRGPFGRGYQAGARKALLVGGGYGAAPLHFLSRELLREGAAVEAALGARSADGLLFADRFAALGVPLHLATEDGSRGMRGRVTDAVSPLLASGRFDELFACGPEGMLESLAALCRAAGVPAQLSYEAYMRCGLGVCGACEHDGRLVCLDGPVFHLQG